MKMYSKPEMKIRIFQRECVVTVSGGDTDPITTWQQGNSSRQLLERKLNDMQDVATIVF